MNQYEKLMEDINNLCNNVLIEENKNTLKIIYINKINKSKINEIFDESKYLNIENQDCNICNICLSNFKEKDNIRKMLNCNHFFHKKCIDKWFIKSNTIKCPICKI